MMILYINKHLRIIYYLEKIVCNYTVDFCSMQTGKLTNFSKVVSENRIKGCA